MPEAYKAAVEPEHAVEDLRRIAALAGPGAFDVRLYPAATAPPESGERRFTLYLAGAPATLTAVLPLLQQLGVEVLDERPSEFVRADGLRCWIYDFGIRVDDATRAALAERPDDAIERGFCRAFSAAWRGDAESDRFSALVLRAGLPWREVAVLRAYARYARQLGHPYGPQYMADTLLAHPAVARGLLALFRARFDPQVDEREEAEQAALAEVRGLIDAVTGLDADRILRGYLAMITATLRTNWFRERPFVSFKFDPAQVPGMPAPRPKFEIFVYSPRVEGVHLRFGPVARGGLRYSDRPQDYRTEILGLVKAQAVKNAVIVPVGAKGGFVVRRSDAGPDEVEYCYRTFVSGLLDVTDNLVAQADGTTDDRAAAGRRAPRRGRLLPGRRGGQGHGAVLRHRERRGRVLRVLAGRRVRLRRVGRLRPQGHGHHGQGRVGERQAALPRAGDRHPEPGVHGRRRRGHVRRRVRQRDAALAAHPAAGRVRPPARVRRPGPRRGPQLRRAQAACSRCRARRGTTTTGR